MANIKTGADFIREAINRGYGNKDDWTPAQWDAQISDRYDAGRDIASFRITDITENSILGATGNYFGMIKMMNNLDRIIENETDPVKKAAAMAVRHVGFPECERIIENNTIESIKFFRDEIIRDPENKVSQKAISEFDARVAVSNRAVSGRRNLGNTIDPNAVRYEEVSSNEQLILIQTLIGSFMDREVCRKADGQVRPETQPMRDLLGKINACANDLIGKANGEPGADFKPSDDREKADFEALKNQIKALSPEQKTECLDAVRGFSTLAQYANMDITPKLNNITLTLGKNPVVKTTAESFVKKQTSGDLSFSEIEWGESNLDNMAESLYTADELKRLKNAGYDPAMGILVDGQPIGWEAGQSSSTLDSAKKKCEIVANAMQGSKIDVMKFVPDGMGGYKAGDTVPVKTDLSMNTERRSIWTILKQIFGFIMTLKDKVFQANNEVRDYQINPDNSQALFATRKLLVGDQLRKKGDNYEQRHDLDIDFFSEIYPVKDEKNSPTETISLGITDDTAYSENGSEKNTNHIVHTMGRQASRVNLAILYGMTKGHSYEEMTADTPEAKVLRGTIGKDFVNEIKVCKIQDYAKANNLDLKNDDTRKQYNDFILGKFENIEKLYTKSCEAFVKLPIVKIDPNDHANYIENTGKLDALVSAAKDISQSYGSMLKNTLAPSDPKVAKTFARMSAVFNHGSSQLEPTIRLGICNTRYSDFFLKDKVRSLDVDAAVVGKSALTYFKNNSENINTVDDLNKAGDLTMNILALGNFATYPHEEIPKTTLTEAANLYLPSEHVETTPVVVDTQNKRIKLFNDFADYRSEYDSTKVSTLGFVKGIEKYNELLPEDKRSLPLSEKLDDIKAAINASEKAAEKSAEAPKRKIGFSELVNAKNQVNEKPREATPKEKTLDMGGINK